MTGPIGLALLFLMAVAPALPWRKASAELLRTRLQMPAWAGALTLVGCVVARCPRPRAAAGVRARRVRGGRGALRQLVLAARRQGWRGLVGRANGGMVVHLGVVLDRRRPSPPARCYSHRGEVRLRPGQSARVHGHDVTLPRRARA